MSSRRLSRVFFPRTWLRRGLLLLALSGGASFGCRNSEAAHAAALPRLGTVGPFWLTDQAGRSFSEQNLNGQVWVAAFMFTRCPTICPELTRRMRYLQEQAQSRNVPLHLLSFSVDPENDTPEVLRNYAAQYEANTASWSFLTGDNSVIRKAAEEGFKIGVDGTPKPGAEHYGITHGTHLVLLDGTRTIRGYYQSSEPTKLAQLLDDAAALSH
ncbi:MAG TPA: SCO family protein [Polyangiaceae bacterium]|nr:SCO family protein [Polyangiaceae bacterium]